MKRMGNGARNLKRKDGFGKMRNIEKGRRAKSMYLVRVGREMLSSEAAYQRGRSRPGGCRVKKKNGGSQQRSREGARTDGKQKILYAAQKFHFIANSLRMAEGKGEGGEVRIGRDVGGKGTSVFRLVKKKSGSLIGA